MKNRILTILFALILTLGLLVGEVSAVENASGADTVGFVYDTAQLLTEDEQTILQSKANEIAMTYDFGIYIVTVNDYTLYSSRSVEYAAEYLYKTLNFGVGDEKSGIMLLLSMNDRDYDLCAYGYGHVAFTDYGKGELAKVFLDDFKLNDWYGGFCDYQSRCEEMLQQAGFPLSENPPTVTITLPDAKLYVPYRCIFSRIADTGASLKSGKLPAGMSLDSDGVIAGIPTELGVFNFTASVSSGAVYVCRLSVLWQGGVDVEEDNEPGYGFVETATDNGRVHDQFVTSTGELKPQTMHCEGAFSEFYALYLDARTLTRETDYTASEGSSRLTLTVQTLANAGSGTHVLTAEFHTNSGGAQAIKYTTQKYTITGIPGKNVNVVVKGVPVIWTDAEPYVNKDSRTMVPFRAIADALGLTVDWNSSTREAIFSNGSKTIYFPLDSKTARTSIGGTVTMDTAAISVNGRSYAPVRYLAEFFGYTVTWDGKTRTVGIG